MSKKQTIKEKIKNQKWNYEWFKLYGILVPNKKKKESK